MSIRVRIILPPYFYGQTRFCIDMDTDAYYYLAMDIQHTLALLSECGLTDREIGQRIGAPQSIVTRLRNGIHKNTTFDRGMKIVGLLEEMQSSQKKKAE